MKKNLVSLSIIAMLFGGCTAATQSNQQPSQLNENDFISETALHDAVRAKDIELVKHLVSQNVNLNSNDIYGYTPLHIAVRLNEYDITKYLIENSGEVNSVDKYKDTPLLDSTRDNYTEVSKLLICNGASRDVSDRHQMTPLHNSSKNNNKLISDMLTTEDLTPYCNPPKEEIPVAAEPVVEAPVMVEETVSMVAETSFVGLYDALMEEFKNDFEPWNAEIIKDDLLFRFNNPVALYETGKSDLKEGFTDILSDFFPRYLLIIEKYKNEIQEIRIEGHTSSEYKLAKNDETRYQLNKTLSQDRAAKARDYAVNTASLNTQIDKEWIENTFKPYGMAYDNPILNPNGSENIDASRRVDFKIVKISQ